MIRKVVWAMSIALLLSACGGRSGDTHIVDTEPNSVNLTTPGGDDPDLVARFDIKDTNELYPYRANSPYASVLKNCASIDNSNNACRLDTLPFITQATPGFTRSDIMDRLLVTHDWMGKRFEALLAEAPESMVTLFGSVTAISIGSTVRPSYYWTGTGAIRLDPYNLWLSVDEKANISIDDDYRSGYGADLQYWFFGTLRNGDQPASYSYSLTDRSERTLNDIKMPVYRLLYHELAHAVDYLPSASVPTLDSSKTPSEALYQNRQYYLSPSLYFDQPLNSSVLFGLGQVSFRGVESTAEQNSLSPADVGIEMAGDGAVRYYAYSTEREDFATLFTMGMMKMQFGLDFYVAFVSKPADEESYGCDELTVGWGRKNRLADPLVLPRAKWVVESIYGASNDIDEFFTQQAGNAVAMTTGVDWCTNRDGSNQADLALAGKSKQDAQLIRQAQQQQLDVERRGYTH